MAESWADQRSGLESLATNIGTPDYIASAISEALSRLADAEDGERTIARQRDALLQLFIIEGKCTVCGGAAAVATGMRGHARRCSVRLALAPRTEGRG